MREICKSGSMRGRWKRVYGWSQRGTKLETADTGKTNLRDTAPAPYSTSGNSRVAHPRGRGV
jgi:hypothetical protein